jgi:2-dehydro-3-deoxyphosphogluconate aldolase / (4S)-4-hydroxy-2-oxoglutarate aldolase
MTEPLDRLRSVGVVAVLRAPSAAAAVRAVDALVAGGVLGIEITFTTPGALEAITEITHRHADAVYLGAGTVLEPRQAEQAVEAGAEFLVTPGTDPLLAGAMRATGALTMIGALTPSEVMAATRLNADVVKLFPASLGGPAFLRALRGPFPDVPFMPTGGVSADNIAAWYGAGAVAVGAGGELCSAAALKAGDWPLIERTAARFAVASADAARP